MLDADRVTASGDPGHQAIAPARPHPGTDVEPGKSVVRWADIGEHGTEPTS